MRIVLSLSLLFTTNCVRTIPANSELTVKFAGHRFSQESYDAIVSAADDWTLATGGYIQFRLVSPDTYLADITIGSEDSETMGRSGYRAVTVYSMLRIGGRVTLPHDVGSAELRSLALHEIGHALGLPHSACAGCVMAPSAPADRVTCEDLELLCSINRCDPSPWCEARTKE